MNWQSLGGNSGMSYMNIHGGTLYRYDATNQIVFVSVRDEERHSELKKIANG